MRWGWDIVFLQAIYFFSFFHFSPLFNADMTFNHQPKKKRYAKRNSATTDLFGFPGFPPLRTSSVFPAFFFFSLSFFFRWRAPGVGVWGGQICSIYMRRCDDAKKINNGSGPGHGPWLLGEKAKRKKKKKKGEENPSKKPPMAFFLFCSDLIYIYIYIQLKTTQFLRSPLPRPPLLRLAFGFCFELFTLLSKNINIYFPN